MATIVNLALQDSTAAAVAGTALTGAPGDGQPAVWRIENSKPIGLRPTFKMSFKDNAARNARAARLTMSFPYTATVNGVETVIADTPSSISMVLPTNVPQVHIDDMVAYLASFLNDPSVVAALKATYAPS